jgi:hypothetical protein
MLKRFKRIISLVLSIIIIVTLSGCASYKARPLKPIDTVESSPFLDTKAVSFSYRVFDKKDCRKYLDRDVLKQGYQPVHIRLTNSSEKPVYFSRKSISLPTVDAYEVAHKVHTNTAGRAVGYGVAGLFVWPFLIPAIVDGVGSAEANEQLDIDFENKALNDQIINPYETVNGLIFVPMESFAFDFRITLTDPSSSQPIVLSTTKPAQVLYA